MLRRGRPLLFAALLKQPHCRAFVLLCTPVPAVDFVDARTSVPRPVRGYSTTAAPPGWAMAPKRGHWQRKKEERSRSFAKRGRVGGWGDYGPNGPVKQDTGSQTAGDSSSLVAVSLTIVSSLSSRHYNKPQRLHAGGRSSATRRPTDCGFLREHLAASTA